MLEGCGATAKARGFVEDLVCLGHDASRRALRSQMTKLSRLDSGIWRFLKRIWFHFVPCAARTILPIAEHTLGLVSGCFLEFNAPRGLLHEFALYVPDWFLIRH